MFISVVCPMLQCSVCNTATSGGGGGGMTSSCIRSQSWQMSFENLYKDCSTWTSTKFTRCFVEVQVKVLRLVAIISSLIH